MDTKKVVENNICVAYNTEKSCCPNWFSWCRCWVWLDKCHSSDSDSFLWLKCPSPSLFSNLHRTPIPAWIGALKLGQQLIHFLNFTCFLWYLLGLAEILVYYTLDEVASLVIDPASAKTTPLDKIHRRQNYRFAYKRVWNLINVLKKLSL